MPRSRSRSSRSRKISNRISRVPRRLPHRWAAAPAPQVHSRQNQLIRTPDQLRGPRSASRACTQVRDFHLTGSPRLIRRVDSATGPFSQRRRPALRPWLRRQLPVAAARGRAITCRCPVRCPPHRTFCRPPPAWHRLTGS